MQGCWCKAYYSEVRTSENESEKEMTLHEIEIRLLFLMLGSLIYFIIKAIARRVGHWIANIKQEIINEEYGEHRYE